MTQLPFPVSEDVPSAKREIMRAALELFATRGLAATSIRDIAAKSGYTNPALYKHFTGKEALALHLFEACHRRVWSSCSAAIEAGGEFPESLERFVACWLDLLDDYPEALAFLDDSARELWPRTNRTIREQTMIGLARSLALQAPGVGDSGTPAGLDPDVAAASIQGTLSELGRMIQVGVVTGPAAKWHRRLVALFGRQFA